MFRVRSFVRSTAAKALVMAACALSGLAETGPATAADRKFININVFLDANGDLRRDEKSTIERKDQIFDGTYIYLDLRVQRQSNEKNENNTKLKIMYSTEQALNRNFVECSAETPGRLEMLDDSEYYLETKIGDVIIQSSIFPGARSIYTFNDVFCSDASDGLAELRIRGYYYVLKNDIAGGVDVQLRPVELTPEEAETYTIKYGRSTQ